MRASLFCRVAEVYQAGLGLTIRDLKTQTCHLDQAVTVRGWVKSVRRQKKITFAEISDGSTFSNLHAVIDPALASNLSYGCAVSIQGHLKPGLGREKVELQASSVDILGPCDETFPIQKKAHGTKFLRDHVHLRPRTDSLLATMRIRSACQDAVASLFKDMQFTRVETPILTSSDCEGGSSVFRVESAAFLSKEDQDAKPFFEKPTYLSVSSQLYLEALASSISRVWTLAPAFRAERSLTSRHLAEFWMLEAEMAFPENLDAIMNVVEACAKAAWTEAVSSCGQELRHLQSAHLHAQTSTDRPAQTKIQTEPWPRITYTQAIHLLSQAGFELSWGEELNTRQERWLADEHFKQPVFVTHYPRSQKPFYMRAIRRDLESDTQDEDTVACFDLLAPGVGEIAGGSLREESLEHLLRAMQDKAMKQDGYEWYLDLQRYGSAPHGGFGMGWERLVAWITGIEHVKETIAFPRSFDGFAI